MTARVIAFCIEHAIYLLIPISHCSHELQLLDMGLFAPLKRALARETDGVARLDSRQMSKVERTEMCIRAHSRALTMQNICSG